MRSWTIIVSAGLHALAAVILARTPARTPGPDRHPGPAIEITMLDVAPVPPVPSPARPPEPLDPAASSVTPASRSPRAAVPGGPPAADPMASLEPRGAPAPGASRSLDMRPDDPAPDRDDDGVPTLDLRTPSAAKAARAYGLQIGAPVVNMRDPGPTGAPGEPTLGRPTGGGRHEKDRRTFTARVDSDGRVHLQDKPNWQGEFFADPKVGVGYRATFDVTDWLMRLHGDDPYWYEKHKYLEETRDERDEMALAARTVRLRESLGRLPGWLDAIWRDERWPAVERRRLLFLLWDECAERGPDDVVRTSLAARVTIEAFVRKRLPEGSAQAYPAEELETLNAGRDSQESFRPYQPRDLDAPGAGD